MKASHSEDTRGMSAKTRSRIISKLDKAARIAESLAQTLSQGDTSTATPTDILEAYAYAALLRGAAEFERQNWEACLKSYAVARVAYTALSTPTNLDTFKDLLSETIDPSIRYAAYQAKIPRTQPVTAITQRAFSQASDKIVKLIRAVNATVLEEGHEDATEGSESTPATLAWRGREVKIEDAAIAVAWGSVQAAKSRLAEKLSSSALLQPKDMAAAYDGILEASQDAVDATKQAIDELKNEGVAQGDPRMQSLQITRTAVSFELISWRIGRNRVLVGQADGAFPDHGEPSRRKRAKEEPDANQRNDMVPGRQIARLKEKAVLYDGTLQSIETIRELPGVANDEELTTRLDATLQYFTALKYVSCTTISNTKSNPLTPQLFRCLAISRSHLIAGNDVSALALVQHALNQCTEALPILSTTEREAGSPRNLLVSNADIQQLHGMLTGELHRDRALVGINNLEKSASQAQGSSSSSNKPALVNTLSSYPSGGVDLQNIVRYPPQIESIPVKPIFLDVAWNYISYPDNQNQARSAEKGIAGEDRTSAAEEAKPKKKGWFGFGR